MPDGADAVVPVERVEVADGRVAVGGRSAPVAGSADRALFHGRDDLARALAERILAHRCVTVYGPSGSGKSSLMQAAVIPALVEAHAGPEGYRVSFVRGNEIVEQVLTHASPTPRVEDVRAALVEALGKAPLDAATGRELWTGTSTVPGAIWPTVTGA